jgi:AcrR family transcriptional regulator
MGQDTETGLPASIEAAWGLRSRPGKGPRPELSLDRIVDAAVKVAAADGLEAVSMSRVAGELGASTMALYRYVAAKQELLDLMVDSVIGQPPEPVPGEGWRAGLARWAWAERAVYYQHPWVLRVPIRGMPVTPNQIAWMDRCLACLDGTGLSEAEKLGVLLLLTGYVRNSATIMTQITEGLRAAGAGIDEMMAVYRHALAKLAPPGRFPALARALASGALDQADPPDEDFTFGLERILDGVDALVRERAAS